MYNHYILHNNVDNTLRYYLKEKNDIILLDTEREFHKIHYIQCENF